MTPSSANLVKFIGAMFNAVPGAYMGTLEAILPSYGGDINQMMRGLSYTGEFLSTLPRGATDREIAFDFVNRIVGEKAAPGDKAWAVSWMADQKAAGVTWGEIVYAAISALDGIRSGTWAAAADQMRARAAYVAGATEGWAATVTDLGTLRDVFSYSNAAVYTGYNNLVPLTKLADASGALAAAASGVGSKGAGQAYTIGSSDTGKAVLLGGGNDVVTVIYADLVKPAFVSGGDGDDTLVVRSTTDDGYNTFMNTYLGVLGNLAYRGFEKVVFQDRMPVYAGSIDGVKEFSFTQRIFETNFGSVDNGTIFDVDLVAPFAVAGAAQSGRITFLEFAPYNHVNAPGAQANASAGLPQLVDSLTFNIKSGTGTGGTFTTQEMNVKHLTWNVTDAVGDTAFAAPVQVLQPSLETLKVSSNLKGSPVPMLSLTAPALRTVDLSGSTGQVQFLLSNSGAARTDGIVDAISVRAPQGLFAFRWDSMDHRVDTYIDFQGEFKAGSSIQIQYSWEKAANLPATKVVFNSDFSELTKYYDSGEPFANTRAKGSVFQVAGAEKAAVYFKGVAAPGQTIGTVSLEGADSRTTTVKMDSGAGVDLVGLSAMKGIVAFINNGQGSVLDNVKAAVSAQLGGLELHETTVEGGRLIWADMDWNGKLDGVDTANAFGAGAQIYRPWASTPDFVMMETSDAHLAQFNQSIALLGFNPVVDLFL